jgi:hypothetical protein
MGEARMKRLKPGQIVHRLYWWVRIGKLGEGCMQIFARWVASVSLAIALFGAWGMANADITISVSGPQFLVENNPAKDTFEVLVSLATPFPNPLDSLDLQLTYSLAAYSWVGFEQQPGVPGTFEKGSATFGSVSFVEAATIPVGPLLKLKFDATLPIHLNETIKVTVIGRSTFTGDESEDHGSKTIMLVPEPTTYALFGAGLALLGWVRARRALQG